MCIPHGSPCSKPSTIAARLPRQSLPATFAPPASSPITTNVSPPLPRLHGLLPPTAPHLDGTTNAPVKSPSLNGFGMTYLVR